MAVCIVPVFCCCKGVLNVTSLDKGGAVPSSPVSLTVAATVAAHDKDINCVAFAPNNSMAATGSQDRTAKLWKLPALSSPLTLRGHKRGIWDICFSPVDQVSTSSPHSSNSFAFTLKKQKRRDRDCLNRKGVRSSKTSTNTRLKIGH